MATYTNWNSLKAGIRREFKEAMKDAMELSLNALKMETSDFYVGVPEIYVRTGAFGDSPKKTNVSGGSDSLYGEVYMDGDYTYSTGSHPSGYTVFNWAEEGAAGIIGRTGTWERAEKQIEQAVNAAFASHFGWG